MNSGSSDVRVGQWIFPFLVAAVSWGSSFLFIEVALEKFSPSQVAFGRVAVGAVVLAGILVARRRMPRFTWRQVGAIAIVAAGLSGAPFILIPAAQEHITSILASLLNATVPLWTALFVALLIPTERATRLQWFGLVVGVFGIAVLLGVWNAKELSVIGAVLMLSATAFYGIGSTMSRMLLARVKEPSTSVAAAQIALSALILLPFAALSPLRDSGDQVSTVQDGYSWLSPWWALILLGVFGTSFAYVLFWRVIAVAGATTAASVTYVVPIIATALGIVVLGEKLLWYEPVGAAVVLTGVWLSQRKPTKTGAITTT